MSGNIETGQRGGATQTSGGAQPQGDKLNISQRVDDLEKRAKDVSEEFRKLEKGIEKHQNFTYFIVGTIAIVFAITSILIAFDYFVRNEERYEKFIDKTQEIQQDVYTKIEVNSILKEFKDCIWFNGLSRCLK